MQKVLRQLLITGLGLLAFAAQAVPTITLAFDDPSVKTLTETDYTGDPTPGRTSNGRELAVQGYVFSVGSYGRLSFVEDNFGDRALYGYFADPGNADRNIAPITLRRADGAAFDLQRISFLALSTPEALLPWSLTVEVNGELLDVQPNQFQRFNLNLKDVSAVLFSYRGVIEPSTYEVPSVSLLLDEVEVSAAVPEPATWLLLLLGGAAMLVVNARRQAAIRGT